jgi:hypothetical protein
LNRNKPTLTVMSNMRFLEPINDWRMSIDSML